MVEQKNGNKSQFTQYYYDVNNRVIRIYSGLSKPLTFNGADNVISHGDDDYSVIKYTYDFYGNKSSYTDNHNKTETYQYNQYSGWLEKVVKRDGTVVTYTYDVKGNVISETAAKQGKATVKKTYTYDYDNNKQTAVISKKAVGESNFTDEYKTTYNNNENGAVYNEKTENFVTGNVINKAYEYDIKGNTTKLTVSKVADGSLSQMYNYDYTYYDDGKLETEKYTVTGAEEQPIIRYTYDNNGNVLTKEVSNSLSENDIKVTSSFTYNLANECTSETHNNGSVYNYSYVYSPDGNMTESSLSRYQTRIDTKYTYDKLNRLTSEEQEEYNENNLTNEFKDEYSFDDYNNITEKVHTETDTTKNTTVVSTYDKTRLSTQTENGNVITYTYDVNGNMSTKACTVGEVTTQTVFAYDTFDRTASITLGNGVTTSFAYNTDSDRISKTSGNTITETVLDNGSVCADLVSGNNALTTKVYSDNNSVYCQNGVFTYNVINSNGDLVATSESNGVDYKYNAYGTKISEPTTVTNPIGYRNYYYDNETGLYYLKARYYDSTTGQFTQEDTVHDDNLQYNLYGYCSANPIKYIDPSGHWYYSLKDYYNYQKKHVHGIAWHNFTAHYNSYKSAHDTNVKLFGNYKDYIWGQSYKWDKIHVNIRDMMYNKAKIKDVGCELIAVYNVMKKIGKRQSFVNIIDEFVINGLSWNAGYWGTESKDLGKYFDNHNVKYSHYYKNISKFENKAKKGKIAIISFWNSNWFWDGIHTVATFYSGGKWKVYNYNSKDETIRTFNKLSNMLKDKNFIRGYVF